MNGDPASEAKVKFKGSNSRRIAYQVGGENNKNQKAIQYVVAHSPPIDNLSRVGGRTIMYHIFFEQSGTFKNELRKLGHEAYDYDIRNDFGETDHIIDLFLEIERAYRLECSIFNNIKTDDMIIAFFPCVRFEDQSILNVRGVNNAMKNWALDKKLQYSLDWHDELHFLYNIVTKLVVVCLEREIPLVIENPYSAQHYITRYWPVKPAVIDKDRRINGDHYKKPTQYFFIGCEPKNNILFEPIEYVEQFKIKEVRDQVKRSLIHPQYANRFLRQYVLEEITG